MRVTIDSESSYCTNIEVINANGDRVFEGALGRDPDGWHLAPRVNGFQGDYIGLWRSSRGHLAVLADALKVIARLPGGGD